MATSSTCALHHIGLPPQAFGVVIISLLSHIVNSFVSTGSFPSACTYALTSPFLTSPFPDTIPSSSYCFLFTVHPAPILLERTVCYLSSFANLYSILHHTSMRLLIMHYWNSSINNLDLPNVNTQFYVPIILDLQIVFDTTDLLFSRLQWHFLHLLSFLSLWLFIFGIFCRIFIHAWTINIKVSWAQFWVLISSLFILLIGYFDKCLIPKISSIEW